MAETAFKLRCGMNDTSSMPLTAPSGGSTAGQMAKVEDTIGVYVTTEDAGDQVAFMYRAKKIALPKATDSGVVFTAGDKVYCDTTNANVTNVSSGNTLVGTALEDAVAADTTLLTDFDGRALS